MDFQAARVAMVESQIRPNGVRNPRILRAFAAVPREAFLPEKLKPVAYIDETLRVGCNSSVRQLMTPMTLARLLEHADPASTDKVLDIGGVTGYSAAILTRLCREVLALESSAELAANMKDNLAGVSITVVVESGPLQSGLISHQPYNLIVLNGGAGKEPKSLYPQLAEGGRLLCIIGTRLHGQAYVFSKINGIISGRPIFDAAAEILPGFEDEPAFVF